MEKGMIKVSVLYPGGEGKTFDMDYYRDTHMNTIVKESMGDLLKGIAIDKGVAGGTPGSAAPYAAMGHMYFDSLEDFQKAFGPHAKKILGDIPNFTNVEPVVQINEIQ